MLIIKLLAPKSPVKSGRRGSFKFKFKDAIPKKPAKRKIINAQIFLFFSDRIRKVEISINIKGIIF